MEREGRDHQRNSECVVARTLTLTQPPQNRLCRVEQLRKFHRFRRTDSAGSAQIVLKITTTLDSSRHPSLSHHHITATLQPLPFIIIIGKDRSSTLQHPRVKSEAYQRIDIDNSNSLRPLTRRLRQVSTAFKPARPPIRKHQILAKFSGHLL